MNSLNILLAEDNADDVFLLRQAFKKAGSTSHLYAVDDGRGVLEYLKGDGEFADRAKFPLPDILLLDVNMPQLNGFEVLEWLRHEPRHRKLVVYVLTASGRDADVQKAYELGANSYIVKPSRLDVLIRMISALQHWHEFVTLPQHPVPAQDLSAV